MMKNALAKQVKVHPSIHTALEQFQPMDLPLDSSVALFEREADLHSHPVLPQLADKRAEFGDPSMKIGVLSGEPLAANE